MHLRRPIALGAIFLACALSSCGGVPDAQRIPDPGSRTPDAPALASTPFPHEESDLAPDPAIRWGALPNGARYAIMRSAQPPGRVSLRLRIASGSLLEEDPQRGLAHMLEHMAFNGSRHYAPGELIPALQRLGIGFGNQLNAHTGFDETVYKIDLPDARPETLEIGLTVLADQAGGLLLDPAEVERERGVVLSELRDRDGPGLRLQRRELALLTAGTRIADRMPIGHAETVAAATPELLRRYYEAWYRPERMMLGVAGDLDPDAAEAAVRRILGTATALAPAIPEPSAGTLLPGLAAAALHDAEAKATAVRVTGVRPHIAPPDTTDARREQFLRDLGEAVLGRRLRKLIEADTACPLLAGGGFSYPWLGLYLAGVSGQAKPGRALDALRLLATEYRRIAEHGPTAAELAVESAAIRAALDQAVAQAGSRRNEGLAAALYDSIADRRVLRSPQQERELGHTLLASATPTAVRDAIRSGWNQRIRTIALVTGRDDLGVDGDRAVDEALQQALSAPVEAPVEEAAATWAYTVDAAWDGPLPTRNGQAAWIIGNANGISLAVQRTDFQPGHVLLRLRLPVRTGPRQTGLAELVARGLTDGGLGRHPASQLAEVLAGTTVRSSGIQTEDAALVLNASCAPQDLRRSLELMRAWLIDAGWRTEAEARAKSAWLTAIDAETTDVEAMTWRHFAALTLPDDPWRRTADRSAAEAASFAAARAWLEPLLAAAPLTCAIVGDIDETEAMRQAAAILGGTRPPVTAAATPAAARDALPAQPAMPAGEHRIAVSSSVAKATVIIAWPTEDQYDVARARRLGLLGGAFGERLREVVRERFGDAYSPAAWHASDDDWAGGGRLMALIGCQPERVDAVRDACLAIAAELAGGIDEALLHRVRQPMLRSIAERRRQNGWWLGLLARAPEQPFRLQWQETLESDLSAATAHELSALAAIYLVPGKALIVIGIGGPAAN